MSLETKIITDKKRMASAVISLDFEMKWGFHDKAFDDNYYKAYLDNEREVVINILRLFSERNMRATWACVGALACSGWDEYFARAPKAPQYGNYRFAAQNKYADLDPGGHYHFAPDLLEAIQKTPGQELGAHTFSHIYMCEEGVSAQDVRADMIAFNRIWKEKFNESPVSFVFPRNQVAFLSVIKESGMKIWRGNETTWYFDCNEAVNNNAIPRILRRMDSLNPLIRRAAPLDGDMTRSSLFLRTDISELAWQLHLSRIRNELNALTYPDIFHLWFHPYNLGCFMTKHIGRLETVLDIIAEKCKQGLIVSHNMSDLVEQNQLTALIRNARNYVCHVCARDGQAE